MKDSHYPKKKKNLNPLHFTLKSTKSFFHVGHPRTRTTIYNEFPMKQLISHTHSSSQMATSVGNNFMPPTLISNLQQVLIARKNDAVECQPHKVHKPTEADASKTETDCAKPVVLVTNGEGVESPGLTFLVEALVRDGRFDVHVCAPQTSVPHSHFLFSSLYFPRLCLRLVAEEVWENRSFRHEILFSFSLADIVNLF